MRMRGCRIVEVIRVATAGTRLSVCKSSSSFLTLSLSLSISHTRSLSLSAAAAMSHLAYPNLARLPDFPERGLNYTGLPMEGWATPVLLAPLSLAIFAFLTAGLPRRGGWQAWWALLNTVIIHPMDL